MLGGVHGHARGGIIEFLQQDKARPGYRLEPHLGEIMTTRDRLQMGAFLPPHHPNDEDPTLAMERDFALVEHLE